MKNKFILLVAIALFIKLALFSYMVVFAPEGKFQPDSADYLKSAEMIATKGAFALESEGKLKFELFRTPGYPFFLAVLGFILKIPLEGVIFIQVLLGISVAYMVYKATEIIYPQAAPLAALIVLYSPPVAIFSLQVLADLLFLFLISLFVLVYVRYLKSRDFKLIVLSAVLLGLATYVRPVSYYFCAAVAVFTAYANIRDKKWLKIPHALVLILIAYGIIGIWLLRNHVHFGRYIFTNIQSDYNSFPIFKNNAMNEYSLGKDVPPVLNYIHTAWRCFMSLMTRPGSLKYLHNHFLTSAGKVFGYPFMIFWWIGMLAGFVKLKKDIYYQFILLMMAYFIFVTIAVIAKSSGERYLLPMIPLIAIVSAAGWIKLKENYLEGKRIRSLQ